MSGARAKNPTTAAKPKKAAKVMVNGKSGSALLRESQRATARSAATRTSYAQTMQSIRGAKVQGKAAAVEIQCRDHEHGVLFALFFR